MAAPVIHGMIMARNEWPLLEVSVTHALVHHVDRVHVLDHGSTDGTAPGLQRLRRQWGDRLVVLTLGDSPFLQEAAIAALREAVAPAADDWLYVFDADEFGIVDPTVPLRAILAALDPRHDVARYEVHNWVAPTDFAAADVARYAELRFRAAPPVFLTMPTAIVVDQILSGAANYFDIPFDSKVLVRGSALGWIAAGSHQLVDAADGVEAVLPRAAFQVAHLPLLDRRRLAGRVSQGECLRDAGFPPGHGWQSQMLVRVADSGSLDAFWTRHSVDVSVDRANVAEPVVETDDALVTALAPTLARVIAARRETVEFATSADVTPPADAAAFVPAALHTIHRLQMATRQRLDVAAAQARERRSLESALAEAQAWQLAAARRRRRRLRPRISGLFTHFLSGRRLVAEGHGPKPGADDLPVVRRKAA